LLNKKQSEPESDKAFEQMQKKEKLFTSVINTIFFIVLLAVLMVILSILNIV